jgi:predicted dehydrogenase
MLKAAVIGLGRIGFEFGLEKGRVQPASHFHCYMENSLIDEIAVADIDPVKRGALSPEPSKHTTTWQDYNTMMAEVQPDIVSICTPTSTHKEVACAVATYHPKTIILEKPLAQSLNEADAILEECRKNDVSLNVNYGRRWSEPYRHIAASSAEIVTMVGHHPGPLMRTGTHMIDLFNMMMCYDCHHGKEAYEDDVTVQAFGRPVLAEYMKGTDDYNVSGVIQYGDDASAILVANLIDPKLVLFELDVTCKTQRYVVAKNGSYFATYAMTDSHRYKDLKEYEHLSTQYFWKENMLQQTLRSILIDTTLSKINRFDNSKSARETLRLALAMHYSAKYNNRIMSVKEVPLGYTVRSY